MKSILMLGAGACQVQGIQKIKELGYRAIVADYSKNSLGKYFADESILADVFYPQEVQERLGQLKIDGVLTVGTDQPVLTGAILSEKLGLHSFLSPAVAEAVTNKKVMKNKFRQFGIPTARYVFLKKGFAKMEIQDLTPPFVLKPLDSQGQRGIFLCQSEEEIQIHIEESLSFSREEEVLVEEYYESDEITVTGWVRNREVIILAITDRIRFQSERHIGVCIAHEYPSKFSGEMKLKIEDITRKICSLFQIKEGPIYFQFLIGEKGIMVNEIACRIGGAYESVTIPYLTGVDLLKINIQGVAEGEYDNLELNLFLKSGPLNSYFDVELLFCKSGKINTFTPIEELLQLPFVLDAGYHFQIGDHIKEVENASQRFGYVILKGNKEEEIRNHVDTLFSILKVEGENGENLLQKRKRRKSF